VRQQFVPRACQQDLTVNCFFYGPCAWNRYRSQRFAGTQTSGNRAAVAVCLAAL